MFCFQKEIKKIDMGGGIVRQDVGEGGSMNVLHWNMSDGALIKLHHHRQEQFGYIIKGGFEMQVGLEKTRLGAGDSYFIPPNVEHSFLALGDTEAIDVFSPVKDDFPWEE